MPVPVRESAPCCEPRPFRITMERRAAGSINRRMKATYSIVHAHLGSRMGWSMVLSLAGKCDLAVELFPTKQEAGLETGGLLALAWALKT
jgi:hypothetical protein